MICLSFLAYSEKPNRLQALSETQHHQRHDFVPCGTDRDKGSERRRKKKKKEAHPVACIYSLHSNTAHFTKFDYKNPKKK